MFRTILIAVLLAALAAVRAPATARDEPRIVVGLHDGDFAASTLTLAEPALNRLGLILEPHNTAEPLPNLSGRSDVRGLVIWLDAGFVADTDGFTRWLRSVTDGGVPVALMGATPLAQDRFGMFLSLGLIFARDDRPYSYDLRAVEKDIALVEHERRFDNLYPTVDLVRPLDPALSQPLLVLQRRGDVTDRTWPLVVTPKGAFAAPNYAVWLQPHGTAHRWFIDPAAFFRLAFKLGPTPAPDPTTLNARRILAPAFLAARASADAGAAAEAVAAATRRYPAIPMSLAADGMTGTPVPRGGQACANRTRVIALGFDGALAALDDGETPQRVSRYAPLFSVCASEAVLTPLAVSAVLDHAGSLPLIAVPPAMPAAIDAGFASVRLEIEGEYRWRVRDREGLQTVRIDDTGSLRMDWQHSEGVIGAGRVNGALYISLDPVVEAPLVALTATPWAPPLVPVLVESRWLLSSLERDWSQARADVQGYGPGDMVWSVPVNSAWEVRLTTDAGALYRYAVKADEEGVMAFALPPLNGGGGTLEMLREDISGAGP